MTFAVSAPNLRGWTAVIRYRLPDGSEIDVFEDVNEIAEIPQRIAKAGHEMVELHVIRPEMQRVPPPAPRPRDENFPEV